MTACAQGTVAVASVLLPLQSILATFSLCTHREIAGGDAALWFMQVLTQEKAAIKIQAGVRGLLTRLQVHRTAQEELQFIGMKPKVGYHARLLTCYCLLTMAHTVTSGGQT